MRATLETASSRLRPTVSSIPATPSWPPAARPICAASCASWSNCSGPASVRRARTCGRFRFDAQVCRVRRINPARRLPTIRPKMIESFRANRETVHHSEDNVMRAAVMRNKKLVVDDIATPAPGPGEALVKTLACGICGSDLHALKHAEKLVEGARRSGGPFVMDLKRDIVMGHEFCAEVVDYGPQNQRRFKPGARVCAMPVLIRASGVETVGYSNEHPGGYGEFMRLTEKLLLEVPNGLPTERAALTEPLAVGYHPVAKARMEKDDAPLVIGCGPVGLAVIAALKLKGVHPIVAADFSPRRRDLAQQMGADVVVDPKEKSPYESWRGLAAYKDPARAPQVPPWMSGPALRPAVIFE